MFKNPPKWVQLLKNPKKLSELITSDSIRDLVKKANKEYLHWDKFRYQKMPEGIEPETAWAFLKFSRYTNRENLPIRDEKLGPFSIMITKEFLKDLSYIDQNSSGSIASSESMPDEDQKKRLIINGLIEEAISSSQIEGASTTRKVAKAMIEQDRIPKNKDERMILNNYKAMVHLDDWKSRPLTHEFMFELHKILTDQTLENPEDEGCFRKDDDEIVVKDSLTPEIIHVPPKIDEAKIQLKQLYNFINTIDEEDENYLHPFVKATILHFCIGYIHPFTDGNGRLARTLFYWYLLKNNYWMFKFLPISLQIKKREWKPGYYRAFKYVETDELDISYFLHYKLKLAKNAIEDFRKFIQKKQSETKDLKNKLVHDNQINTRQLDIIELMQRNASFILDLSFYKERYKVAYETARSDIRELVSHKILKQETHGKKYTFIRGENFP